MKNMIRLLIAASISFSTPALADVVTLPVVNTAAGLKTNSTGAVIIGSDGVEKGTPGNPLTISAPGGSVATAPQTYQLMTNATASGATVTNIAGGGYVLNITGTFNGSTITLQVTDAAGALVLAQSCTATCTVAVNVGQGSSANVIVAGGPPSGIYARIAGVGGPFSNAVSAALAASEAHVGEVGGHVTVVGASFTRPANTTAYAANQLFANSTTAGSVVAVPAPACRVNQGHGAIVRGSLSSSNPLAFNIQFRLHIFKTAPTSTVGDGGTWPGSVNLVAAIERGKIDVTLDDKGSDGAKGFGAPNAGNVIGFDCAASSQNLYVLVETLGAYTPLSGETETVALEVSQD